MIHRLCTWDAWSGIHQPFELDWWKKAIANGHCSSNWELIWREVKDFIRIRGDVIDIGCGPRPPFAPCTVIEPLAEEYKKITPPEWWNGVTVIAQPAENLIAGLDGDTIICWNCIDHAIGWQQILSNMLAYGRKGARFAICTDFHSPFIGHPGFSKKEFMTEIMKLFVIEKYREPFGRDLALILSARDSAAHA